MLLSSQVEMLLSSQAGMLLSSRSGLLPWPQGNVLLEFRAHARIWPSDAAGAALFSLLLSPGGICALPRAASVGLRPTPPPASGVTSDHSGNDSFLRGKLCVACVAPWAPGEYDDGQRERQEGHRPRCGSPRAK